MTHSICKIPIKIISTIKQTISDYCSNFFPQNFPKRKLFPLLLLLIIEAISQSMISSFAGYLIADMKTVESVNESGTYNGWLTSVFYIGQLVSSYFIGALSDNFGRRPLMLIGTLGIAVTNTLFGFSFHFIYALCIRFLDGLLNGNVGVVKSYMTEITDDTNRIQTFSFIGLAYSIGCVFGTLLGGVLYDPCSKYPKVFGTSGIFKQFPALFPQLLLGILGLISLILAYFYLPENDIMREKTSQNENKFLNTCKSLMEIFKRMIKFFNKKNIWSIFCSFEQFLMGGCGSSFFTLFPLLMIADVGKGGFGATTNDVGYFSAVASLGSIFTLLFIYKPMVRNFGLRKTYSIGLYLTGIFYAIYPSMEGLNGLSLAPKWICYCLMAFCWNLANQCSFSSILTLIVNGADIHHIGAANGVAQAFVSFGRVIGPIIFSPLLSWTLTNELNYPINQYLPFYILTIILIFNATLMFIAPKKLERVIPTMKQGQQFKQQATEMENELLNNNGETNYVKFTNQIDEEELNNENTENSQQNQIDSNLDSMNKSIDETNEQTIDFSSMNDYSNNVSLNISSNYENEYDLNNQSIVQPQVDDI